MLRYADGGGYSMHHDGNARALTVLYYLNGEGVVPWKRAESVRVYASGTM